MKKIQTVGSLCSGIEAASVAWADLGFDFEWFSEIAKFPSELLAKKYPHIPNLGDMNLIPKMIKDKQVSTPDLICGGTPCQAFSFAGWQNGLNDDRGNLTLKFVDIIEANDTRRIEKGDSRTIVFWENVEGVSKDKTNAFGCLVSSLAGFSEPICKKRWSNAGVVRGPKRNVAWRLLDAKYFGVPQQRKRLYLLAGGKEFFPENILFEKQKSNISDYPTSPLTFDKDGHTFEVFREYTDCLYAAYGTKWNGNAAAYNGSLFIAQDGKLRRLSPLECERLMGFPDNYTNIAKSKNTTRYQGVGNSWVVPVVKWIGQRLTQSNQEKSIIDDNSEISFYVEKIHDNGQVILLDKEINSLNCSMIPENPIFGSLQDIADPNAPSEIYISPVGCGGILRRCEERKMGINARLKDVLVQTAATMPAEEIEKRSRVQHRGRFSEELQLESSVEELPPLLATLQDMAT